MKNTVLFLFLMGGFFILALISVNGFPAEKLSNVSNLQKNDLGVSGTTWPIAEEDLLAFIEKRIRQMQQNGEMQIVQARFQNAVRKKADRPQPVAGMQRTTVAKTHLYDPSVLVPVDLKDLQGNVFATAGTRVNPLKWIRPKTMLVFYDADDSRQAAWAANIVSLNSDRVKPVLVKGSVAKQSKRLHIPVYFDQAGKLTGRFNIQQVPAIVCAEGTHLRIDEVLP